MDEERHTGIKKTRGGRIPWVLFVLALLYVTAVVLYAQRTFVMQGGELGSQPVVNLLQGWRKVNSTETGALSASPLSPSVTVYFARTLPQNLPEEAVICFYLNHQVMQVYLDGELSQEFGRNAQGAFGTVYGGSWNFAEIPQEMAGKEIVIGVDNLIDSGRNEPQGLPVSSALLGSRSAVQGVLLKKEIVPTLFGVISLLVAVGLFVLCAVIRCRKTGSFVSGFFYLGVYSLMSGIWVLTDSHLLQLFWGNHAVIYFISFFTFMLLPIPFLLYVREIFTHGGRVLNILCVLFALLFALSVSLYISNIIEIAYMAILTHVLIGVSAVSVVALCIREIKVYQNRAARETLGGILLLIAAIAISIGLFYSRSSLENYSRCFRIGLLLFILLEVISACRKGMEMMNASAEAEVFRRMAFMDGLTRLGNRAAFEREMEKFERHQKEGIPVALIICDMNNLKRINDGYGHDQGDQAIKMMADCLRATFDQRACFRIGGDEFAILLTGKQTEDVSRQVEGLLDRMRVYSQSNGQPVTCAAGYAACIPQEGVTMDWKELYHMADEDMYRQKKGGK